MDTSDLQQRLRDYLSDLNWSGGVSKDDIMERLVERGDDALRTMVNEYIAEGTYPSLDEVMTLIPAQAWQDAQGDRWQGVESQYVEDVETHFRDGQLGRDELDPGTRPRTTGTGGSSGASGSGSSGQGGKGPQESAGGTGQTTPHGGHPGDGAGRIENPGTQHAGVWPVSGPPPDDPDARMQGMASFGQGARGAAGYEDSGRSEVRTVPPDESSGGGSSPARGTKGIC